MRIFKFGIFKIHWKYWTHKQQLPSGSYIAKLTNGQLVNFHFVNVDKTRSWQNEKTLTKLLGFAFSSETQQNHGSAYYEWIINIWTKIIINMYNNYELCTYNCSRIIL